MDDHDRDWLLFLAQLAVAGWAAIMSTIVIFALLVDVLDTGGMLAVLTTMTGVIAAALGLARLSR